MTDKNEKTFKKKQNELLGDALGFKTAESEPVNDSFQEGQDCTVHSRK